MPTVIFILIMVLILLGPKLRRFLYIRGQQSPETIHREVLVPYGNEQSYSFDTEAVHNSGVEIPILYSIEGKYPIVLSSVTLIYDTSFVNERTLPIYCTAIRIGLCIKNPTHQSNVLYRHPKSSRFTRKGPFVFTNKRDWETLSEQQLQTIHEFIQTHNSVRYRSIAGSHDILVPPKLKETVQQHGLNMFLSTEYFSPQVNPAELAEKIQALQTLAQRLEGEND